MKLTIVVDNPRSWIIPYARQLKKDLQARGHTISLLNDAKKITKSDCAFFLSCERIVSLSILGKSTHNLVVHESALPKGKGWSPLTWQILEGKSEIPVTLFEAVEKVDAGDIYDVETIRFEGHELVDELRQKQGEATMRLILRFVDSCPPKFARKQRGKESFYPRRTPKDSELDTERPLKKLFNQLRVADNERYPAFFMHQGHKYIVKIYKDRS